MVSTTGRYPAGIRLHDASRNRHHIRVPRRLQKGEQPCPETLPAGRKATEFIATTVTGEHEEFRDPDQDYPRRFRYTHEGKNTLFSRLDDGTQSSRINFAFERTTCNR